MIQLTIAKMAEQTGVSAHTLRYYEKIGLLDPVERAANGHRIYGERDILRVNFLKRVRATGMTIQQMLHYVELFRQGDTTIIERRRILEAHRAAIQAQMQELEDTCALLDHKIDNYHQQEQALNTALESETT